MEVGAVIHYQMEGHVTVQRSRRMRVAAVVRGYQVEIGCIRSGP